MTLPSGLISATPKTPRTPASRRASLRPRSPPRPPVTIHESASMSQLSSGTEQKLRRSSSLLFPTSEANVAEVVSRNSTSLKSSQIYSSPLGFNQGTPKFLEYLQKQGDENGIWNSRFSAVILNRNRSVSSGFQLFEHYFWRKYSVLLQG